ncbi:hypothetical protein QF021_002277 [Acidovorax delafieldii]|uniref:AAA family ATPase n=1 Tax=Acidovorax delafieldii TaxID=47920 RepID=UPI0028569BBA|nr:AAA family ATPase [Acidovorax delafieldii]MDR6154188.1 hypothetical protein [Acidovorax delafieldii]
MTVQRNAAFDRLVAELQRLGPDAQQSPAEAADYQSFVQHFSAAALPELTLDAYCVGKNGASFCWWLERGLEPLLGRYMPGTARGHLLYFAKDGSVYKHRKLSDLPDAEALRYTLKVHAAIASADPTQDLRWVDDDAQIYQRAGVAPRVTMGEGRKLRLLAAYRPDAVLPISSSEHLAHFLRALGCPAADIPPAHQPVARMLKLMAYFAAARELCPGITPQGFMKALYAPALGLAPPRDVDEVLEHFAAVPNLAEQLKAARQTEAFCQLVLALHESDLDWWVTQNHTIHAGRSDDPQVWTATKVLVMECTPQGVRARLHQPAVSSVSADDDALATSPTPPAADGTAGLADGAIPWQLLDADVAARLADGAAADPRVPALQSREACWPDDYDGSETTLSVVLSQGAIRNGYLKVPKLQALFPPECIAPDEKATPQLTFTLALPNGESIQTWVQANRHRLRERFGGLFNSAQLKAGDRAVIHKDSDGAYRLIFQRQDGTTTSAPPGPITAAPVAPISSKEPPMSEPLNQILFGPPGTGKTHATIDAALKILDRPFWEQNKSPDKRNVLKDRFDALLKEHRVRFVTFHQSFSYEDFVEGIRATVPSDDDEAVKAVSYEVQPGVFVRTCRDAKRDRQLDDRLGVREGAKVWKLSIEEASGAGETRQYCLTHGEARIGWPDAGDLNQTDLDDPELPLGINERHALKDFGKNITPGDVVVCLATKTTISAVGVVTGDYEYTPQVPAGVRPGYVHKLPVKWLATGLDFNILELNRGVQLTLKAVYHLWRIQWPDLLAALRHQGVTFQTTATPSKAAAEPYVLIIDEINRGNIARIFGELITLIEPSKRAGADEALEVVLPYSRTPFSVPPNVYLIGTMNTADRSLMGLDVALRRRFVFQEMPPCPDLLDGVTVPGVDGVTVGEMLRTMNQRIEALLDRDHCLGHAYFMPLRKTATLAQLGSIFRNQVLPLLQEYFFDDWQRIQWVLNDHRKAEEHQFVQSDSVDVAKLLGPDVNVARSPQSWRINPKAFDLPQSYQGIVQSTPAGNTANANLA